MEDWIQLALGQGGALIVMIWGGRIGFKFLTKMIDNQEERAKDQEAKSDLKNKRFDKLHESTLAHISSNTRAVENLSDKIEDQVKLCEMKKVSNG